MLTLELSSDCLMLFQFPHERRRFKHFKPKKFPPNQTLDIFTRLEPKIINNIWINEQSKIKL